MSMLEELKNLGANTDEGLRRFMNNAPFYQRMLGKFVPNAESTEVMAFLESGDYEKALANAHTLKGVTGNLSLTPLFNAYDEIVTALRANDPDTAKQKMEETIPIQQAILACIKNYQS